jgi:hypothetical protein
MCGYFTSRHLCALTPSCLGTGSTLSVSQGEKIIGIISVLFNKSVNKWILIKLGVNIILLKVF